MSEGTPPAKGPAAPGPRTADGPPPAPRWVKGALMAVLLLVVLLGAAALITGGQHGPGRHGASAGAPSVSVQPGEPW